MRILYLTDLHFMKDENSLQDALNLVKKLRPSILLLGGDYDSLDLAHTFLSEVSKYCSTIITVLGNNDHFDASDLISEVPNVYVLDGHVVEISNLAIGGICRNISHKPKQFKKTLRQYLEHGHRLAKYRIDILLIHETPLEIAGIAKRLGIIESFDPEIASTVSNTIRLVKPRLVLTGHLHTNYLTSQIEETIVVLTCWLHRTYIEAEVNNGAIRLWIRKYTNNNRLIHHIELTV